MHLPRAPHPPRPAQRFGSGSNRASLATVMLLLGLSMMSGTRRGFTSQCCTCLGSYYFAHNTHNGLRGIGMLQLDTRAGAGPLLLRLLVQVQYVATSPIYCCIPVGWQRLVAVQLATQTKRKARWLFATDRCHVSMTRLYPSHEATIPWQRSRSCTATRRGLNISQHLGSPVLDLVHTYLARLQNPWWH